MTVSCEAGTIALMATTLHERHEVDERLRGAHDGRLIPLRAARLRDLLAGGVVAGVVKRSATRFSRESAIALVTSSV
jgi:hypothetical protein